ncbi:MAG: hypothetical protein K8J08_05610 [Thermoanaerobaculia bacterium]|nr:hypothetical protein [Thermoanaerobaculia bacterium]
MEPDLCEFIGLLNSREVDYLIVGGHAVAFHGFPRYTGDFDFFVRRTEGNARSLVGVLDDFGFGSLGISEEVLLAPNRVLQLGFPPDRIDILTSISGVDFDQAWAHREPSELAGIPVHFIGREELLINKRASGRPVDLGDLSRLEPSE